MEISDVIFFFRRALVTLLFKFESSFWSHFVANKLKFIMVLLKIHTYIHLPWPFPPMGGSRQHKEIRGLQS